MLPKLMASATLFIAVFAIVGSYSQMTALYLNQQRQFLYWPHRNTHLVGIRHSNRWHPSASRSSFTAFRGGGTRSGK